MAVKRKVSSNKKPFIDTNKPYIDDKDHLIIPSKTDSRYVKKYVMDTMKLAESKSQWKKVHDEWTKLQTPSIENNTSIYHIDSSDKFPAVLKDVSDLLAENQGTSIPYIASVTGSFLINPCPVSMSTFMKMWQTDDVVNRCIMQNINSIIQGIGDYHHENPECKKIGRLAISHLQDGITGLVEMVTSASIVNGMFAGIIDSDYLVSTPEGYVFPGKIRHMPELSIQFTADNKGDINNIYQYVYSYPYAGTQNALSSMGFMPYGDLNQSLGIIGIDQMASLGNMDYPMRTNFMSNFGLVQLDKRFVLHYAQGGASLGINPYGFSWLLPIYNLWLMKQLCNELYMSAMSRLAHPMTIGYASHSLKIQAGETASETMNAIEILHQALQDHTEDSALVLPGLKGQVMEVDVVHNEGDFSVFEKALDKYNKGIESGLKIPAGSYESNQSYAGITAQSSQYMRNMAKYRKDIVDKLVLNQYMRWVLQTNYDENINDFGQFDIDVIDIDDRLKYSKLYAQNFESGTMSNLNPNTIKTINKQMGLPELSAEELEVIITENLYRLKTGSGKQQSSKDNSNKQDMGESMEHYKHQRLEEPYKDAIKQ